MIHVHAALERNIRSVVEGKRDMVSMSFYAWKLRNIWRSGKRSVKGLISATAFIGSWMG